MYSCSKKGELRVNWAVSRLSSSVIFFFVNITNCASLCALEINVNEKITCKRQDHSFISNDTSQALSQTLQTTKMNFEKLLGWQVLKNPQFQSVLIFF